MKKQKSTENFLCGEFIGLKAKVALSEDPGKKGLSGRIVDETMNTFVLETKNGEKTIPKKEAVICFVLPNRKKVSVDGKKLVYRPEDRVKSLLGKKIED